MDSVSTVKHNGIIEVFSFLIRSCVLAIKGLVYITGGLGGLVIVLVLLLPLLLVASFLLKFIGF